MELAPQIANAISEAMNLVMQLQSLRTAGYVVSSDEFAEWRVIMDDFRNGLDIIRNGAPGVQIQTSFQVSDDNFSRYYCTTNWVSVYPE
jgi:hypothetical protein